MAFLKIKLSHRGRKLLSVVFTITSILTGLISLTLIIYGLYISAYIAPNLPSEKAVITLIFTVITMHGMELLTYYSIGLGVCRKCYKEAYKKHSRYLLRIWIFTGYSSVINIVVIGTMAAGISNHIVRSMHHSMERGMALYLKDPNWKVVIDSLQINMQCCGAFGFEDWYRISWMNSYMFNWKSQHIKKYTVYGDHIFVPVTPWSCCRTNYPTQCFHDPIQQKMSLLMFEEPENLSLKTINHKGCIEVLREPLENGFLIFILSSYIILFLQTILTILSRVLFFSYRNAIILGDPLGVAPGWLFGSPSDIFAGTSTSKIKPVALQDSDEEVELTEVDMQTTPKTRSLHSARIGNDDVISRRRRVIDSDYSTDDSTPKKKKRGSFFRRKRRLRGGSISRDKASVDTSVRNRLKEKEEVKEKEETFVYGVTKILADQCFFEEVKEDVKLSYETEESESSRLCADIENRLFLKFCQK